MSQIPESYEFIESYLRGELTSEEKELFEKRLTIDPAFNEEYQTQKGLNELILEKNLLDLRRQVEADLNTKSSPWKKPALIIAALVLSGGLGYYLLVSSKDEPATRSNTPIPITPSADTVKSDTKADSLTGSNSRTNAIPAPSSQKSEKRTAATNLETVVEQTTEAKEEPIPQSVSKDAQTTPLVNQKVKSADTTLPCPAISFHVEHNSSCKGKATGSIVIAKEQINGGLPPYTFSIGNSFGAPAAFHELEPGNYTVKVQDKKGCISEKNIALGEKTCAEHKDYSFNPEVENWKMPFFEDENGTMTITNRAGKMVYRTNIPSGQPSEWNGRATNGEALETGAYLYIAQSEKGEVKQGYIIILK